MRIFIGVDDREPLALRAAINSLRRVCDAIPEPIHLAKMQAHGLIDRAFDYRGGRDYDLVSNAHQSTRFAITRFLVPMLCQQQWALFVDSDVVFLQDPHQILDEIEPGKAVYVVKHDYVPEEGSTKMEGQTQEAYPRKAASSVMLFDCGHPGNQRLSLRDVNERPGRDLHRFYWLAESEIGEINPRWNWLVGVQPPPPDIGIAHFTLGGPFTPGWKGDPQYDELWRMHSQRP